jgi:hypothetical protein
MKTLKKLALSSLVLASTTLSIYASDAIQEQYVDSNQMVKTFESLSQKKMEDEKSFKSVNDSRNIILDIVRMGKEAKKIKLQTEDVLNNKDKYAAKFQIASLDEEIQYYKNQPDADEFINQIKLLEKVKEKAQRRYDEILRNK